MLKINEQGITIRIKTPSLAEMDRRVLECRRRLRTAILKARKECKV